MGQTEAYHGERALSQLHRQKYVWNVSVMLFWQHVTGGPPGNSGHKGYNKHLIYILLVKGDLNTPLYGPGLIS